MRSLTLALVVFAASPALARPDRGIGVDDRRGVAIPGDIQLRQPGGQPVALGDYFDGERPVILVLAYVRCAMLCDVVLRQLASALRELERVPGEDYRVITVSLDPGEKASEAAAKQRELHELIGRSGETGRWSYLLGHQPEIERLADALGFRYRADPRSDQLAHPAVVFVLDPFGVLSAALTGPGPEPESLAASLDVAATGDRGAAIASAVLRCFRFDPALRRYRERIQIYFQIGAGIVFVAVITLVIGLLWRETRRRMR